MSNEAMKQLRHFLNLLNNNKKGECMNSFADLHQLSKIENELKEDISIFQEYLEEKLILLGKKAYPKFGNVVIMAGGGGSGKGFVLEKLLGIEGKVFDVDKLKELATRSPQIIKKIKDEIGIDISQFDTNKNENALKKPDNVSKLHEILGDFLKLPNKTQKTFFSSVLLSPPERKPNIIFDVTLKDFYKFNNLAKYATNLGYDKKNIHIVWVINHIDVAQEQNLTRNRTVSPEIMINIHRGVSNTMHDIINLGKDIQKYMDGDIVFVFNQVKVDSKVDKSEKGGSYITDAKYVYVKRAGMDVTTPDKLSKEIKSKIAEYVPKGVSWD